MIQFNVNQHNQPCVYLASMMLDGDWQPMFVGVATIASVTALNDAKRNSEWQKLAIADRSVLITLLDIGMNDTEQWITKYQPWCNLQGTTTVDRARKTGRVRCIDTGDEYDNAAAAAAAHCIAASALSAHLAGKPYHVTVGGLRFERIK